MATNFRFVLETFQLDHLLGTALFLADDFFDGCNNILKKVEPFDFNNGIEQSPHDNALYLWIASIEPHSSITKNHKYDKAALTEIFNKKYNPTFYNENYIKYSQLDYYKKYKKYGNFMPCYRLETKFYPNSSWKVIRIDLSISHYSVTAKRPFTNKNYEKDFLPYI